MQSLAKKKFALQQLGGTISEKSFLCWAEILEDQEPLIAEGWKLRLLNLQLKSEKAVIRYEAFNL